MITIISNLIEVLIINLIISILKRFVIMIIISTGLRKNCLNVIRSSKPETNDDKGQVSWSLTIVLDQHCKGSLQTTEIVWPILLYANIFCPLVYLFNICV